MSRSTEAPSRSEHELTTHGEDPPRGKATGKPEDRQALPLPHRERSKQEDGGGRRKEDGSRSMDVCVGRDHAQQGHDSTESLLEPDRGPTVPRLKPGQAG